MESSDKVMEIDSESNIVGLKYILFVDKKTERLTFINS